MKELLKKVNNEIREFNKEVTLENFVKALETHKELGKKSFKANDFSAQKISKALIEKAFAKLIETDQTLQDNDKYSRVIFIQDNGYSVSVSERNGEEFKSLINFKTYSLELITDLQTDYGFFVR